MALPVNQGKVFTRILYDTYCTLLANKANPTDYLGWIEGVEKPGLPDAARVEQIVASFTCNPSISILLQVQHFTPALLKRCIRSVIRQSYPYWELCIAGNTSTGPAVRKILSGRAVRIPVYRW